MRGPLTAHSSFSHTSCFVRIRRWRSSFGGVPLGKVSSYEGHTEPWRTTETTAELDWSFHTDVNQLIQFCGVSFIWQLVQKEIITETKCSYLWQITFWCLLFSQHIPVLLTASHICAPLRTPPCKNKIIKLLSCADLRISGPLRAQQQFLLDLCLSE